MKCKVTKLIQPAACVTYIRRHPYNIVSSTRKSDKNSNNTGLKIEIVCIYKHEG